MSAEEISLNSHHHHNNHHTHHHLVFADEALRFTCGTAPPPPQQRQHQEHHHQRHRVVGGTPDPKASQPQPQPPPTTRELAGFLDEKFFSTTSTSSAAACAAGEGVGRYFSPSRPLAQDFSRSIFDRRTAQGDESEDDENGGCEDEDEDDDDNDEDDDDDDDVDGGDGDIDGHSNNNNKTNSSNRNSNRNNNGTTSSNADNTAGGGNSVNNLDKLGNGKAKHISSIGPVGDGMVVKDGGGGGSLGQGGDDENVVTIAEPEGEMYYTQYLQAAEGSAGSGEKEMGLGENGCGFSVRKDNSLFSNDSGESLRQILSDPVTGALMDDAMILPCGHSFGGGGIQHVIKMKACYTCSQSISEDSVAPNLSLRAAVQAFRREEEVQFCRQPKRKREKFDQDKGFGDATVLDAPRARGVQFPFSVTDRVIIKGNKRTPQRFVGREAVVTTQCLNGWYVVKTLDNAESVKLQYRSLAKVPDDLSSKAMPSKMAANWL